MTTWEELPLTAEHAELLEAAAITPDVAATAGVHSATEPGNVPTELQGVTGLPALIFPWRSPSGVVEYQARPDVPAVDESGRARKYLWRRGMVPVLGRVTEADGADTVWLVEGTKQALAAASYAPKGVEVYGIGGCRMWMHGGAPITDLEIADERDVVIILDADASGNRDVYDAGTALAAALEAEGAKSVSFVRLPGGKSAGLDDVLAARKPDKRAGYLARLVVGAKSKPAETKPKTKAPTAPDLDDEPPPGDRPAIVINRDRYQVIGDLTEALRTKWDGTSLFNYGQALAWLEDRDLTVIEQGAFLDLIARTARTVAEAMKNGGVTYSDAWPDSYTIKAVYSRAGKFAPLERVARAPFVRLDGSICQTPGYDEASRTVLVPDEGLDDIAVPDDPGEQETAAALALLRDEWLGDLPFEGDASRANALALILTPLVRGLVPRVPLAVVDGLQMGVGKNLFAECLMVFATGRVDDPKPYTTDEEEQRKFITAAFRSGDDVFVFDEAHELRGNALARALTSAVYSDRILGVSTMAKFPNRVTWVSLGNNVQVHGDVARRVYRIRLAPAEDNPQDRPQSSFRHPDLVGWTREHRADLLTAALTLIRAWFAAGQPPPERKTSFGSFEAWEKLVGGILATAGQPGFLDNISTWRSESDFDSHYWTGHLAWLHEAFGGREFSAGEVRSRALADAQTYAAPPRLDDPTDKGYAKALGEGYARVRDRGYDGYRLRRTGIGHRKIAKWFVEAPGSPKQDPLEGPEGPGGTPNLHTYENHVFSDARKNTRDTRGERGEGVPPGPSGPSKVSEPANPAVFDLETAGIEQLYRYGSGFVRLAGYTSGGLVRLTTDIGAVVDRLRSAPLVIGHNILGFDLQALARYHGLDIHELVNRGAVFDTLLAARHADPPPARGHRKYDLDSLGERYGLGGKHGDLKKLAKEFGGFDKIPADDERYREYLTRDVQLNAAVYARLATGDPYLAREHRVAAIAAQISLNGFAVDEPLLAERVAEGEARKARALNELAGQHGVPLNDGKGKRCKAPLATKVGKQALTEAFERLGIPRLLRTPKAGDLMTSGDAMAVTKHAYGHLDGVARLCDLVATVTSERTIYQTITAHTVEGRVHPAVSMEQSTGRWSITKPGLTVVGKRGGRHREREVFLPDPGHAVISVDLAQVDARAVAALSGDPAYAQLFAPGVDAHAEVARRIWGDASRREDAKAIGHGWNYGMGLEKLGREAGVSYEVAQQFDAAMREQFPHLVAWRDHVRDLARSGETLDNGFGRKMRPDPDRAHTQGPAFMGQGCARDLMMEGLLRLPREVYPYLRAVVHDEVVLSVPAADADEIERAVVDALSFEWRGVQILADRQRKRTGSGEKVPARGSSWGEVYAK